MANNNSALASTAADADTLKPSVPRASIHMTFQGEKLDQLKSM